jgi:hypothetical protein
MCSRGKTTADFKSCCYICIFGKIKLIMDYIIKPQIDLKKGILEQSSPLAKEFKDYLKSVGIEISGFDFDEHPYYGTLGLYLCPGQTFDLACRILLGTYTDGDLNDNSDYALLSAIKISKERLTNITKTLLDLFDKYNIPHKYVFAVEDYNIPERRRIKAPNLIISARILENGCLHTLYEEDTRIVLNELCKAGIKPSFIFSRGSYTLGFSKIPLPLPSLYQEEIYNIVNTTLKQNDRTGFYSSGDTRIWYKVEYFEHPDQYEDIRHKIIKLPYITAEGVLVTEESCKPDIV